jgi:3-methyladenine DNA glycosylase AlkD
VPSQQPAHATRVPDVRKTASEWRKAQRGISPDEVLELCDALWETRWREERIVAIALAGGNKAVLTVATWNRLERWSEDIDSWEHSDHLAQVTGRLLITDFGLLSRVRALESSANPWQRRLALVTLIVAFMKYGACRQELASMANRLQKDEHPSVRRAGVWARDRLSKGPSE